MNSAQASASAWRGKLLIGLIGLWFSFSALTAEIPEDAILIDVIGHHALTRGEVLEGFPAAIETLDSGSFYLPDGRSAERDAWCERLASKPGIATGYCASFHFATSNPVHLITIIEDGREHLARAEPPLLESPPLQLDRALIALDETRRSAVRARLDARTEVYSDVENGVVISDKEEIKAIELKIHALVSTRADYLLRVLGSDAAPLERAAAATLLNYVGSPESWMPRAIPFVNDREPVVRNNVTRALLLQAGTGNVPLDAAQRLVKSVEPLLHSALAPDLNKAITLLALLVVKSRVLAVDELPESVRKQVRYLAENSISPNIGTPARKIMELAP